MKFYRNFDQGEGALGLRQIRDLEKKPLKRKLFMNDKIVYHFGYILVLFMDSKEQVEIYTMREYLLRKLYLREGYILASRLTLRECQDYVFELAKATYRENGSLYIKSYILNQEHTKEAL